MFIAIQKDMFDYTDGSNMRDKFFLGVGGPELFHKLKGGPKFLPVGKWGTRQRMWVTFYRHSAYIQITFLTLSGISPEPYFQAMNDSLQNLNFWYISRAIQTFQI